MIHNRVELITIGDEILIGQIVDTNSAWMATELNQCGLKVVQITSVSDSRDAILTALRDAAQRADIVLITGGLGPTKDDITKACLLEFFGGTMVFNEDQYTQVEKLFSSFGREVTPINRKQAEIPSTCKVLVNQRGTAPGMWFEKNETIYVSMPGVPYEMKWIMAELVIPELKKRSGLPSIVHRTFLTQGIGESLLASWIESWEDALPEHVRLAYLPSPGLVRLRLSTTGKDEAALHEELNKQAKGLYALIGKHIYGEGEQTLPEIIQDYFIDKKLSLSVAESCTGGNIAHMITGIAGSSAYFKGGIVSYSEELKVNLLGVPPDVIKNHGVVSEATAMAMADGARRTMNTDYALSVTGIAGPDGGTEEIPVGTVWIGFSSAEGCMAKTFRLSTNRERNITTASLSALNLLRRKVILGEALS